jgi:hypothetical protein
MKQTGHNDGICGHYRKINSDHIHAVKEEGLIGIDIIEISYDLSSYQLIQSFGKQDLGRF